LVAVDAATKWTVAAPLKFSDAFAVAKFIFKRIACVYGAPVEILGDRGSQFLGNVLTFYIAHLGAKQTFTSAFHPRTNSHAERTTKI
jgi:transposase InsO family protein